jgi:hypothetical protein
MICWLPELFQNPMRAFAARRYGTRWKNPCLYAKTSGAPEEETGFLRGFVLACKKQKREAQLPAFIKNVKSFVRIISVLSAKPERSGFAFGPYPF